MIYETDIHDDLEYPLKVISATGNNLSTADISEDRPYITAM